MAIKVSGINVVDDSRNASVGVLTATTVFANGEKLLSGVGISTSGGIVGTGATIIDFRGAGISTVTVSSGIATINVTGGAAGGAAFSVVNYIIN